MKKRIVVEYGKISQISKDFKVTRQAVYKALNYLQARGDAKWNTVIELFE